MCLFFLHHTQAKNQKSHTRTEAEKPAFHAVSQEQTEAKAA